MAAVKRSYTKPTKRLVMVNVGHSKGFIVDLNDPESRDDVRRIKQAKLSDPVVVAMRAGRDVLDVRSSVDWIERGRGSVCPPRS